MDLLELNSCCRLLRERRSLLIYASCIDVERPGLPESVAPDSVRASVCMEREQFNVVSLKVASILARVELEELAVLTVDGSPHCVQLHHAVEEAVKIAGGVKPRHLVLAEGEVVEVPARAVKTARYLSKVARLLTSSSAGGPP